MLNFENSQMMIDKQHHNSKYIIPINQCTMAPTSSPRSLKSISRARRSEVLFALSVVAVVMQLLGPLNPLNITSQAYRDLTLDANEELPLEAILKNTTSAPFTCQCVDCNEDLDCGQLYVGTQLKFPYSHMPSNSSTISTDIYQRRIHMIISHCHANLGHITRELENFTNNPRVHIISKCGHEVEGAPAYATVEKLPNYGRCDHTYAHYIAHELERNSSIDDNDIVIFMKDTGLNNKYIHQPGDWKSLHDMVRLAAYGLDEFACGIVPKAQPPFRSDWRLSAFHDLTALESFTMEKYHGMKGNDQNDFHSPLYPNLESLYNDTVVPHSNVTAPSLVRVCYGGVFAAPVKSIRRHGTETWQALAKALERGDNIIEGHYVERMWGLLLSQPLEPSPTQSVRDYSNFLVKADHPSYYPHAGMLIHKPELSIFGKFPSAAIYPFLKTFLCLCGTSWIYLLLKRRLLQCPCASKGPSRRWL